jgi:hypothetical protein
MMTRSASTLAGIWLALGTGFGLIVGAALHAASIGLALGTAAGAVLALMARRLH